jgi:predicted regulator of Ras-like GTPase activity (Roadblock/LC7/MglB family)
LIVTLQACAPPAQQSAVAEEERRFNLAVERIEADHAHQSYAVAAGGGGSLRLPRVESAIWPPLDRRDFGLAPAAGERSPAQSPLKLVVNRASPREDASAPSGFEDASAEYASAPFEVPYAPSGFEGAPDEYESAPLESASARSGYESAPVEYEAAPVEYESVPSEHVSVRNEEHPMSRLDEINKVLRKLQSDSPGVEASALISEDGLMIASALTPAFEETRVAGMTATLLNLGTRAAVELGRGEVKEVIIRGDNGYAVMINAGRGALLLALANETSKLGLIFFDMHEAIRSLKKVL